MSNEIKFAGTGFYHFSLGLNGPPQSCPSKNLIQGRILRLILLKLISRQKFRENFDLRETFFVSFVSCAASGSTTPRKNMSGVSIKIKDFPQGLQNYISQVL